MTVLLVGASGLAREVVAVLREAGRDVVGVLDDRHDQIDLLGSIPVVGGVDDVVHHPDDEIVVCIGPSTGRLAVVDRLCRLGVTQERFTSVIDPSVRNPDTCSIGHGSILLAGVTVTAAASLGCHVVAMPHVTVTHDCAVDDGATLASGVSLGGGVRVRRSAYIGMNASIYPGVSIGMNAVVGMGAVVLSDVPDGETWAGVPARALGGSV